MQRLCRTLCVASMSVQGCLVLAHTPHPTNRVSLSPLLCTLQQPVRSTLVNPVRFLRTSPPPPPTTTATTTTTTKASRPAAALPSIEPVLVDLRAIVTRRYPLAEVHRALSPASRKILVAHKLPLEELLLHLPDNFPLYRQKLPGVSSPAIVVCPPHLLPANVKSLRLPPEVKPLPALAHLMGRADSGAAASPVQRTGAGTGFTSAASTPMDRIQEVLTYIPNEWADFTTLGISQDVKMRCMGYPTTKPSTYFLKHPKYFDVRSQDRKGHTFEVRRSLALQKQLETTTPQQK